MGSGMPTWEEWNEQLSEEQRQYSLYKILQDMNRKMDGQPAACKIQQDKCKELFTRKKETQQTEESVRWLTWGVRGIFGIILGWIIIIIKGS